MTDNSKMLLYFQLDARSFAQGTSPKDISLFDTSFKLENPKEFNSTSYLANDEWFFVDLSSKEQGKKIIATFSDPIDNSVNTITKEDYEKTKSIFIKSDNSLIFQRIYPKQRMDNLVLRIFEKDSLNIDEIQGLTVSQSTTDAILNFKEKRLYFEDYSKIKQIFRGIDAYYRIASTDEIQQFASVLDGLVVFDDVVLAKIGERNQKVIASLLDDKELFEKIKKTPIKDWKRYAETHGAEVKFTDDQRKFQVIANKDMTNMLKVLSEIFYTGEVTGAEKEATF